MKPSNLQVHIRAEIFNPQGKLIKRIPWKRANSYVQQLIDLLYRHLSVGSLAVTDTSGAAVGTIRTLYTFRATSGADNTNYGIVIGTGTNPVLVGDYKLQTQVVTNIAHSSVSVSAPVTDGTTRKVEIVRTFTNNTGSALNITEVGLYLTGHSETAYHCIDRSLYNVTINNGESASLRYRIKVTV